MIGHIHSLETMGTVDGPGVRLVLFLQGCPMRCAYCHNPDTWATTGGTTMTVADVWTQFERNRSFYKHGGLTVTGGEALLQLPFIIELFTFFKQKGVHTCLDTSGICFDDMDPAPYEALLAVTDLVILDIKEIDDILHQKLTKHSNQPILSFGHFVSDHNVPLWIRHVVVPTITDNCDRWYRLGFYLGSLKTVATIDCLPYHVMGQSKYKELGITYPLEGIPPATKDEAKKARDCILDGLRAYRRRWWSPIKNTQYSLPKRDN